MNSLRVDTPAVFSFPGQGAPYGEAVLDLDDPNRLGAEDHEIFLETLGEVQLGAGLDVLGLVSDKAKDGKMEDLADTRVAQIILLGAGVAAARILRNRGIRDIYDRGHSAGAFVAAVIGGSLAVMAAAKAIKARGDSMHEAAVDNPGVMAATMGVSFDKLREMCAELRTQISEYVAPANDNSPKQIMVAGTLNGLKFLKERVKGMEGKLTIMPNWRAGMAHTEMVRRVQDVLEGIFDLNHEDSIKVEDPSTKYVRCLDGQAVKTGEAVRQDLVAAAEPVMFRQGTEYLLSEGQRRFIEIGPGRTPRSRVLSGRLREHDLPAGTQVEHLYDLLALQKR